MWTRQESLAEPLDHKFFQDKEKGEEVLVQVYQNALQSEEGLKSFHEVQGTNLTIRVVSFRHEWAPFDGF